MTLTTDDYRLLNTIYIISKGRPQCKTAETLTRLNYPGQWFIVCGTNDETLQEYQKRWGEDRVLVFDWKDETTRTDTLDNFGFEVMPSGAVPVRNATIDISRSRGERRHWQFDDDYDTFWLTNANLVKKQHLRDGRKLQWWMCRIAKFADMCNLPNCGFALTTIESTPNAALKVGKRVFNAHNQSSEVATRWRGRLNDDLINAIDTRRLGEKVEFSFRFLALKMKDSQSESGGLSDIYKAEGIVRKSAYPILIAPNAARLVVKFGRYHHKVRWDRLSPEIINEKFRKYRKDTGL